jgi:hypothetical protein
LYLGYDFGLSLPLLLLAKPFDWNFLPEKVRSSLWLLPKFLPLFFLPKGFLSKGLLSLLLRFVAGFEPNERFGAAPY